MKKEEMPDLLKKVLNGTATEDEKKAAEQWFLAENERVVYWDAEVPDEEEEIEQEMLARLEAHMRGSRKRKTFFESSLVFKIAAVLIVGVVLAVGWILLSNEKSAVGNFAVQTQANMNKYVLLPDSSVIILHPGSTIDYNFDSKTRSVSLTGEAYFDVKHQPDKPFIVTTGEVTTTVLGTAFNISAYPGQKVIVVVTRGKVSVANPSQKLLSVLTPNKRVELDMESNTATQSEVKSAETIAWVGHDMQFNDMPFSVLAEKLSSRYGIKLIFKNELLKKCPITGRFNGTETLEDVFKIIAGTTSASYEINGNEVSIDGPGCSN